MGYADDVRNVSTGVSGLVVERLDDAGTGSRLHVDLIQHDLSWNEWSFAAANWSEWVLCL